MEGKLPLKRNKRLDPIVFEGDNFSKDTSNSIEVASDHPKDSAEHYLAINTTVNKSALKLLHPLFSMRISNDELFFDLEITLSRRLMNEDIIQEHVNSIPCFDFILSPTWDGSFDWARKKASQLRKETYEENDEDHQLSLMCYYAMCYFASKFNDIKNLEDIDREIPIQLFLNVLKKNLDLEIVYVDSSGLEFAGKIRNICINKNIFASNIYLELSVITATPKGYGQGSYSTNLPYVTTASCLEDIGLKLLTPEAKEKLIERGKKYVKYTSNPKYCYYDGFAYKPGGWGDVRSNIKGRVMIDLSAMRTINPKVGDYWYYGIPFNCTSFSDINEDKLWMCLPVVYGFSFYSKEWVRMDVNNLSEIKFSDTAFDELIVPQDYKDIFLASLTNEVPSLDSISGKGAGKIFLLYGPPGTGKTLTAESVSELLRKPLYFVSVGELGTTPEQMEFNLGKVMQVATSWDAVVLLDEVDVFAVDRKDADITKTAMTAILLRLLERFSGIMFMTTNLINNLDPAFISRATAIVPYEALNACDKVNIWANLLKKVEDLETISIGEDIKSNIAVLAQYNINGRDIKNCIRLAYSLAMHKDKVMTKGMLDKVINLRTI